MKNETYQIFRQVISKDEFFNRPELLEAEARTDDIKNLLYKHYILKCKLFNRDSFMCQNKDCKSPNNKLTQHHITARKEGGADTLDNSLTLCLTCHNQLNKGKSITIYDNKTLPLTVRGKTLQLSVSQRSNIRAERKKRKETRKRLKGMLDENQLRVYGRILSYKEIILLLKFLEKVFDI